VTAFATPAQLGAFLQQPIADTDLSALLMLEIASGMVVKYLDQQISFQAGDIAELDPASSKVILPEMPVLGVSLVEYFDGTSWVTAAPNTYKVSLRLGTVTGLGGLGTRWPADPGSWRVTYDHGYSPVPFGIVGAVLGAAARAYSTPAGIDMERIGGYQVKYTMEAEGFTAIEKIGLGREPHLA
jgi:hypothetical protein